MPAGLITDLRKSYRQGRTVMAGAVCLSRAYLGAHFPSDVDAGGRPGPVHREYAQPRIRRAQHQHHQRMSLSGHLTSAGIQAWSFPCAQAEPDRSKPSRTRSVRDAMPSLVKTLCRW